MTNILNKIKSSSTNILNKIKSSSKDKGSSHEFPQVYVSEAGAHYVKPKEFFQSERGKALIKQASRANIVKKDQ